MLCLFIFCQLIFCLSVKCTNTIVCARISLSFLISSFFFLNYWIVYFIWGEKVFSINIFLFVFVGFFLVLRENIHTESRPNSSFWSKYNNFFCIYSNQMNLVWFLKKIIKRQLRNLHIFKLILSFVHKSQRGR